MVLVYLIIIATFGSKYQQVLPGFFHEEMPAPIAKVTKGGFVPNC